MSGGIRAGRGNGPKSRGLIFTGSYRPLFRLPVSHRKGRKAKITRYFKVDSMLITYLNKNVFRGSELPIEKSLSSHVAGSASPSLPKRARTRGKPSLSWVYNQFIRHNDGLFYCKHCRESGKASVGFSGRPDRLKDHLLNGTICPFLTTKDAKDTNDPRVNVMLGTMAPASKQRRLEVSSCKV